MAKMRVAALARDFDPAHAVAVVRVIADDVIVHRLPKTGPTAARVVLGIGAEKLGSAAHAAISPLVLAGVILASECRLGALLSSDAELLGRELEPPLLLALLNLVSAC